MQYLYRKQEVLHLRVGYGLPERAGGAPGGARAWVAVAELEWSAGDDPAAALRKLRQLQASVRNDQPKARCFCCVRPLRAPARRGRHARGACAGAPQTRAGGAARGACRTPRAPPLARVRQPRACAHAPPRRAAALGPDWSPLGTRDATRHAARRRRRCRRR
jgi:hypothetical protein